MLLGQTNVETPHIQGHAETQSAHAGRTTTAHAVKSKTTLINKALLMAPADLHLRWLIHQNLHHQRRWTAFITLAW
jgi:hypothetical protein